MIFYSKGNLESSSPGTRQVGLWNSISTKTEDTVLVSATPTGRATVWFDAFVHWLDVNKFMGKK